MSARTESLPVRKLPGHYLRAAWTRLTRPGQALQSVEERRNARLLSALLLFVTLGVLLNMVTSVARGNLHMVFVPTFLAMVVAYGVSRTRHYQLAAFLVLGALAFVTLFRAATRTSPEELEGIEFTVGWLLLPVLLSSILLSLRQTAVLAALSFGALWLLPVLNPALALGRLVGSLGFIGLLSILLVVAMNHRNQIEKDRQAELLKANTALEAALAEAQEATALAREANRLKSEFLAVMSHELRTPLNAIIGFTEIMLSGIGGNLDDDAMHMTERVDANGKRLLDLINDILDLAKIQARRQEIVPVAVSPLEFVTNQYEEMASLAENKGLCFETVVDGRLPLQLKIDDDALHRITSNLLSNAFKFTQKGNVRLALNMVNDKMWSLSVTDTGVGIPPHALEYIFDEFRQVDGTSRRVYGGTGLGLAIVRQLAEAMDGSVRVKSEVGKGSTFVVTLPLVLAEETAAVDQAAVTAA